MVAAPSRSGDGRACEGYTHHTQRRRHVGSPRRAGTHPWSLLRCGAAEGALELAAGALAGAAPPGDAARLPERLAVALALYVTAVLTSGPLKGALSAFDPGARALASPLF